MPQTSSFWDKYQPITGTAPSTQGGADSPSASFWDKYQPVTAPSLTESESDRMGENESILNRPVQTYFGLGKYRQGATGIEKGAEEFASGLLSPLSLGLMAVTGGLGGLAEAGATEAPIAGEGLFTQAGRSVLSKMAPETAAKVATSARVVSKLANVGFTGQQIYNTMQSVPRVSDAIRAGDTDAALEEATQALLGGGLAVASAKHLLTPHGNKADFSPTDEQHALASLQRTRRQYFKEAGDFEQSNRKLIEDKATDHAAYLYHEAGGDSAVLERWKQELQNSDASAAIKDKYNEYLTKAQNLPKEYKDMSDSLRPKYADAYNKLQTLGLIKPDPETGDYTPRQNYAGTHEYDFNDEASSDIKPSLTLRRSAAFTKHREFPYLIDAIKEGYEPKEVGLTAAYPNYVRRLGAKVSLLDYAKELLKRKDDEGRPMAVNPNSTRMVRGKLTTFDPAYSVSPSRSAEHITNGEDVLNHIQNGGHFAIITAENPQNTRIEDQTENDRRNEALRNDLVRNGYNPIPAEGRNRDVAGETEKVFIVPNITAQDAAEFGRKYGQASTAGSLGIHDLNKDELIPIDKSKPLFVDDEARKQPFYTVVKDANGNERAFSLPLDFSKSEKVPYTVEAQRTPSWSTTRLVKSPKDQTVLKDDAARQLYDWQADKRPNMTGLAMTDPNAAEEGARQQGTDELRYMLAQDYAGTDWYNGETKKVIDHLSQIHPELQDPKKAGFFKSMLAAASLGTRSLETMADADAIYSEYKRTGKVPVQNPEGRAWGGRYPSAKANVLENLQKVLDHVGGDQEAAYNWMMEKHPVSELNDVLGRKTKIPGKATDMEYGARALSTTGKAGNFFLNLNGVKSKLTMDMWASRTYYRWMGMLLDDKGEVREAPQSQRDLARATRVFEAIGKPFGLDVNDTQAALWFYEQKLWASQGLDIDEEGGSYANAARQYVERKTGVRSTGDATEGAKAPAGGQITRGSGLYAPDREGASAGSAPVDEGTAFPYQVEAQKAGKRPPSFFEQAMKIAESAGLKVKPLDDYNGIAAWIAADGKNIIPVHDGKKYVLHEDVASKIYGGNDPSQQMIDDGWIRKARPGLYQMADGRYASSIARDIKRDMEAGRVAPTQKIAIDFTGGNMFRTVVIPANEVLHPGVLEDSFRRATRYNFGAEYQRTGTQFPTPEKLKQQFGQTGDVTKASFVFPDGSMAQGGPIEHDVMLGFKPEDKLRVADFVNQTGAVRTRFRMGRAGQEIVFSVPESITEDQAAKIRSAAGAVKYGRVVIEQAHPGGNHVVVDFPTGLSVNKALNSLSRVKDYEATGQAASDKVVEAFGNQVRDEYHNLTDISKGIPVIDAGHRLTPDELKLITEHPIVKQVAEKVNDIARRAIEKINSSGKLGQGILPSKIGDTVQRIGLGFLDEMYGAYAPDPENPKSATIFIDALKHAGQDPAYLADRVVSTLEHELLHDRIKGHGEDFTTALTEIHAALGSEFSAELSKELRGIYADPNEPGKFHPEFSKALQVYEQARNRFGSSPEDEVRAGRDTEKLVPRPADQTAGTPPVQPGGSGTVPELTHPFRTKAGGSLAGVDPKHIIEDEDGGKHINISDYVRGPESLARPRYTGTDSEGKPTFDRQPLWLRPDIAEAVNQHLEDTSWFRKNPVASTVLKASTQAKRSLLSFSPFHWTTEWLRGIQMGMSPLEALHPKPLTADRLAMTAKFAPDLTSATEHSLEKEGLAGGELIHKIPFLGQYVKAAEDKLFGDYIPRLKADAFDRVVEQIQRRHANWSQNDVHYTASKVVDAAFGGLNWKMLGASLNSQDALRLVMLAPDFTGSQVLFAKYGLEPGGSVVNQSLARIALYNFAVARVLNLLVSGKAHNEQPFAVVSPDEKKAWTVRTMPQDIAHALSDPRSFAYNRLNPIAARTAWEALSGRDERGKRVTAEKELMDLFKNITPIPAQNFIPAFKRPDDTVEEGVLRGVGATAVPNQTSAERTAKELSSNHTESGPVDEARLDRHQKLLQLEDDLRNNKVSQQEFYQMVDRGEIHRDEAKQIHTVMKETEGMNDRLANLYTKSSRLPAQEFLDVYSVATPEERQILLPLLQKKAKSYFKKVAEYTPEEKAKDRTYRRMREMNPSIAPF